MNTQVQKIYTEIERRIELLKKLKKNDFTDGSIDAYKGILLLIDSLQQERPDGLDEEVKKYWNAHALDYRIGHVADLDFMLLCARHFAEWQKKQDQETIELAEDHAMLAGRMQMKEEMMKDAVEGYVEFDFIDRDGLSHVIVKAYVVEDDYGIVTGDKCKCLILKEE